jgi:cell division septation protein DedD
MQDDAPSGVVKASFSPTSAPDHALAAGGRSYWVQVASLRSETDAKAEWDRLKGAHTALLAELPLALQKTDLPDKGTYYRLRSGPFSDAGTPKQLCDALQARDQACLVVRSGPTS